MVRHKAIRFDAMVKFFMQQYGIPTKKDIEKILARLDQLERLIQASPAVAGRRRRRGAEAGGGATDAILALIAASPGGVSLAEMSSQTGFDAKKIRNVVYRLNRAGRIRRRERGLYVHA
jgi:hypothetical protein